MQFPVFIFSAPPCHPIGTTRVSKAHHSSRAPSTTPCWPYSCERFTGFLIIGQRNVVRSITRACVVCRRTSAKPQPQLLGQLPPERITPGIVFEYVGIDYAGPVHLKLGRVRKPTFVKAYICLFVAMSVKAVHLEVVSDLTSAAFIACLRRFIARRGKPYCIWSDHGSNFVGASRELAELADFLEKQRIAGDIPDF